jgi:hypothetical protein
VETYFFGEAGKIKYKRRACIIQDFFVTGLFYLPLI